MGLELAQLNLGKVDGRAEYLEPQSERDESFYDAFLIPEAVDCARLNNSDLFFVEGFRGTGKTSLLRWFAENRRRSGATTEFVLFKSDLPEERRLSLSTEVGISWVDTDAKKMELSQDFKSAWAWFIHHKIGEMIRRSSTGPRSSITTRYLRLLGLADQNPFNKVLGFLPRLEGAKVTVKADLGFFETELEGNFVKEGQVAKVSLDALNTRLNSLIKDMTFTSEMYVFFDELEVFHETPEKYVRDQRMVRDLLFTINNFNELFRNHKIGAHIIGGIRSEVVDSFGALGQEVDRVVHDHGVMIAWHFDRRSINHPLIEIIRRKIAASEQCAGQSHYGDPIARYFPNQINGISFDAFLLDRSFYKPRDIVWRLTIAQKQFPKEHKFTERVLLDSDIEYSSKLWDEIRYELSAAYSKNEIDAIEMSLSGGSIVFDLSKITEKFERAAEFSIHARQLLNDHTVAEIMSDLYRLGAIGNRYRAGASGVDINQRWAFRGDIGLLLDQKMTIHPGLTKRLSAVPVRRRGSPGANRPSRRRSEA